MCINLKKSSRPFRHPQRNVCEPDKTKKAAGIALAAFCALQ